MKVVSRIGKIAIVGFIFTLGGISGTLRPFLRLADRSLTLPQEPSPKENQRAKYTPHHEADLTALLYVLNYVISRAIRPKFAYLHKCLIPW